MLLHQRWSLHGTTCTICGIRSEEHTSELQSHLNLVCRLLLEKKNQQVITRLAITLHTEIRKPVPDRPSNEPVHALANDPGFHFGAIIHDSSLLVLSIAPTLMV